MRSLTGIAIFLFILILLDVYVYSAVRSLTSGMSHRVRVGVSWSYFILCAFSLVSFFYLFLTHHGEQVKFFRMYLFAILIGLFFAKIMMALFLLIDDIRRLFQLFWQWLLPVKENLPVADMIPEPISRSVFMSWLAIGAGTTLFGSLLYGFSNKYSYRIVHKRLHYPNLPASFRGMKIVHISDIHSGSFTDAKAVQKGIDLIIKQNADLILFTGDLVNDRASEMKPYIDIFPD